MDAKDLPDGCTYDDGVWLCRHGAALSLGEGCSKCQPDEDDDWMPEWAELSTQEGH